MPVPLNDQHEQQLNQSPPFYSRGDRGSEHACDSLMLPQGAGQGGRGMSLDAGPLRLCPSSHVTLDKFLNLTKPQFLYLQNGDN